MTYSSGPRLGETRNPSQARFCEGHKRLECTKNRTKGRGQCHGPAVRGLNACKLHSGVSVAVGRAKGEAMITAWSAIGDVSKTIDHKIAVMSVLQMSWLRLNAYSRLLGQQADFNRAAAELADRQISGEIHEGDEPPMPEEPNTGGIIGWRYGAAGKDGVIYKVAEEIRALVHLEAAERDRVVKYAETAHKMGISDRMTDMAEQWGDLVAGRITLMLEALGLTPEQQARVPILVQAHLGSLDVGGMAENIGR